MFSSPAIRSPEFTLFSILPIELQLLIWELSFEERTLTITPHRLSLPWKGQTCQGSERKSHTHGNNMEVRILHSRYLADRLQKMFHRQNMSVLLIFEQSIVTTFTAHLRIHPTPPYTRADSHNSVDAFRGCNVYSTSPSSSDKPPPGPVALHV